MNIKTTDLCDACEEVRACELLFTSFGKKRAFAGNIRTVKYINGLGALRELVNQRGDGQVLVIDAAGVKWRAVLGDVMAELAVRNGWAGIVVNGLIRDRSEIDRMDIGVKALGTVPRRADVAGRSELDIPLEFGGITFTPGSRLIADEDGIVILPSGLTESDIDIGGAVLATAAYVSGSTGPA